MNLQFWRRLARRWMARTNRTLRRGRAALRLGTKPAMARRRAAARRAARRDPAAAPAAPLILTVDRLREWL
jgi:hypothetical protein